MFTRHVGIACLFFKIPTGESYVFDDDIFIEELMRAEDYRMFGMKALNLTIYKPQSALQAVATAKRDWK